jgi:predicted MFS family arabinose efflux permease
MVGRRLPPTGLLIFLTAAYFLAVTVALMLSPLLVDLAAEFRTSVALTGQLTAATAFTWAITAIVVGPVSDTYGRRLIILIGLMLMVVGTLSSVLVWSYGSLLICRFLTGVGGAMIPPNCIATVADIFSQKRRGRAIGWLLSAVGLGTTFGIPIVAFLTDVGDWRLPFYVLGSLLLVLWGILYVWFPINEPNAGHASTYVSHFRELGSKEIFWYLLTINCLQIMAAIGMFSYLATYLMQIYYLNAGETVLPLTIAGLGVIAGTIMGGRVASHRHRLGLVTIFSLIAGSMASITFTTHTSPWITVGFSFFVAGLLFMSQPVILLLLTEMAGQSRATATGMFAVSNQLGMVGGASVGGLMLSLWSFPSVGMFCLLTAATAAALVRFKGKSKPR